MPVLQTDHGNAGIVLGENRVRPWPQAVIIHTQCRHHSQSAIQPLHFILQIHTGLGRGADGKIAHRKHVGQHHRGADPGQWKMAHPVTLLLGAGPRHFHAPCQIVAHVLPGQGTASIQLHSVQGLVEGECTRADIAQRRCRQSALLDRRLFGRAVLMEQLPIELIGQDPVHRIHRVFQTDAAAPLTIRAFHAQMHGAGQPLQPLLAHHAGIHCLLAAFQGQQPMLITGLVLQFGQHAAPVDVLRIGQCARGTDPALAALVRGFAALVMGHVHQSRPAFAAKGTRGCAMQALPMPRVADPESDMAVAVCIQIIPRIAGDELHHAAQGIRSVQRTARAAHHVHLFQHGRIHHGATRAGIAANGKRIRQRHAIHLDAHPVATQPAHADVADAEAVGIGTHAHAGFVAEQILPVLHLAPLHGVARDDIDGLRHVLGTARRTGGRHHDRIQFVHGIVRRCRTSMIGCGNGCQEQHGTNGCSRNGRSHGQSALDQARAGLRTTSGGWLQERQCCRRVVTW